jgi:hypothetical protein
MRGRLVLLIALVAIAIGPASASPSTTGLRGTVLSQSRPVCFEERSCLAPVRGVVLVFRRDGRTVARVASQADGTYRLRLDRGRYGVSVANRPTARVTPSTVRVVGGLVKRVDFELDSGLQ